MKRVNLAAMVLAGIVFGSATAQAGFAGDFVFPVAVDELEDPMAISHNRTNPIGNGWRGNGVGVNADGELHGHLGQDYFAKNGNSAGRRVYAIADGDVVEAINSDNTYGWCDTADHGWGRVIVIRHTAPPGFYFNTDGSIATLNYKDIDDRCPHLSNCDIKTEEKPTIIYSLYGHLSATDFEVFKGGSVAMGQPIARIGDSTEQPWSPHLHLEIKSQAGYEEGVWDFENEGVHLKPQSCNVIGVGSGYSYVDNYAPERYNPNTFIKQRRSMTFEDGEDGDIISSKIAGMVFSKTDGSDWVFGNISTGSYSAKEVPDPTGPYALFGGVFAWLGPTQGIGRIDFNACTASDLSLFYSSASNLYLEAYDTDGNMIDADSGSSNLATGRLDELKVSATNIAYVLVHDTGNRWLIDNLSVSDILADAKTILPANGSSEFETADYIDQDESKLFKFLNEKFQSLVAVLEFGGSELKLNAYDPGGILVASGSTTTPPLIVSIPSAQPGEWTFEVEGIEVPTIDYPMALVVYSLDALTVALDVKPDDYPNCINPKGKGVVPMAILGSSQLDAAQIDLQSLQIGDIDPEHTAYEDVNNDGISDVILHFATGELAQAGLLIDNAQVAISGRLFDGKTIQGFDVVHLIGQTTCR